jgi:hypothetical protein
MTDKEFFDFCYDQYKLELDQAETLYQRSGILLTGQAILGGIIVAMSRADLVPCLFFRINVLLYYLIMMTAFVCLFAGVGFLIATVYPRDYYRLASVSKWKSWREEYKAKLIADDPDANERNKSALEEQTGISLLNLLAEAHATNVTINQRRLRFFQRGVFFTALVVVNVAFQTLFYSILLVQGV